MEYILFFGCMAVIFLGVIPWREGRRWLGGAVMGAGLVCLISSNVLMFVHRSTQGGAVDAARMKAQEARDELASWQSRIEEADQVLATSTVTAREAAARIEYLENQIAMKERIAATKAEVSVPALGVPESGSTESTAVTAGSSSGDNWRERRLYAGVGEDVVVATDKGALDEFIKCAAREDYFGAAELQQAGRLFFVSPYTKVLVLDTSWSKKEIRIMSGEQAGRKGWVPSEWVVE